MMTRNPVREYGEDQILAQADKIRADTFKKAEKEWSETPEDKKQRPWPRCHSIHCNRSLVCQTTFGKTCEGFDF